MALIVTPLGSLVITALPPAPLRSFALSRFGHRAVGRHTPSVPRVPERKGQTWPSDSASCSLSPGSSWCSTSSTGTRPRSTPETLGWILLLAGGLAIIISLVVNAQRTRSTHVVEDRRDPRSDTEAAHFPRADRSALARRSLTAMERESVKAEESLDRQARILEAVLRLLSRHGISGVSMRAVAREAGVALGLVNYYYADKTSLIRGGAAAGSRSRTSPWSSPTRRWRRRNGCAGAAPGGRSGVPHHRATSPCGCSCGRWRRRRGLRADQHRGAEALPSGPRRLDPRRPAGADPRRVRPAGRGHRRRAERHVAHARCSGSTAPRFAGASRVARRSRSAPIRY